MTIWRTAALAGAATTAALWLAVSRPGDLLSTAAAFAVLTACVMLLARSVARVTQAASMRAAASVSRVATGVVVPAPREAIDQAPTPVAGAGREQLEDTLHQVRSGLGAMHAAVDLLTDPGELSGDRRTRLQALTRAEFDRLTRLVTPGVVNEPAQSTELDPILADLAMAAQLSGQGASYAPSQLRVALRGDVVAEVVGCLLDNARVHAPGADVTITADAVADRVHLVVADEGPGVEASLGDAVFSRGVRSSSSPGDGIGLHRARLLLRENGADIVLESDDQGARFVLDLPAGQALRQRTFTGRIPTQRVIGGAA